MDQVNCPAPGGLWDVTVARRQLATHAPYLLGSTHASVRSRRAIRPQPPESTLSCAERERWVRPISSRSDGVFAGLRPRRRAATCGRAHPGFPQGRRLSVAQIAASPAETTLGYSL